MGKVKKSKPSFSRAMLPDEEWESLTDEQRGKLAELVCGKAIIWLHPRTIAMRCLRALATAERYDQHCH